MKILISETFNYSLDVNLFAIKELLKRKGLDEVFFYRDEYDKWNKLTAVKLSDSEMLENFHWYKDDIMVTKYESYTQEEFDEIADELNHLEENFSEIHKLLEYNNYKDLPIPRHTNEDCHTLISVDIMMYEPNGSAHIVVFE